MRAARYLAAVDSHTEGMPTRVVTGGVGLIPGATMLERKLHFEAEMDDLRLLLMREPRGHGAMSGAILQPPARDDETYPISLTISDFVDEQCTPAFATYTGQDLATSDDLDFNYFYPTREGWNDGDREFTCFVVRTDDAKMTSSVRAGGPTSAPSN